MIAKTILQLLRECLPRAAQAGFGNARAIRPSVIATMLLTSASVAVPGGSTAYATTFAQSCADFSGSVTAGVPSGNFTAAAGKLRVGDRLTLTVTISGGNSISFADFVTMGLLASLSATGGTTSYTVNSIVAADGVYISASSLAGMTASWSCTPAGSSHTTPATPQTPQTNNTVPSKLIAQQSGARVQAIVTNQMGSSRQIDRLMDQGSGAAGGGSNAGATLAQGFTSDERRALDVATGTATAPRLGLGMNGASSSTPLGAQLRLRSSYEDDLTSPMRSRGPGGDDTSRGGSMNIAGLNLLGGGDGANFNFSTSLRDISRAAQHQEQQRLAEDPTAAAMGFTASRGQALDKRANPLDIWVEGRFMKLNDGRNGADLSGFSGLFGTGVDYVFNRSLLAGVSLSYDTSGQKSSALGTEARGTGWLVGPYATVRLGDSVFWQSRVAWGRASNDVSPNLTVTDSFGSRRWVASSRLTGRYQMGAWQLRPSAGVAYMEETSDSYVSGTGANVESVKTRVGTASAGPEISYQYRVSRNVLIEPRIGAEAIWTFARDISVGGNSALIGAEAIGPEGTRGRVEMGLRTMITGGTVIDLSGAYDGIGAGDYNTTTGRAVVRMPLN